MTSLDEEEVKVESIPKIIYWDAVIKSNSYNITIAYILQHIERIPAQLRFATAGLITLVELVQLYRDHKKSYNYIPYNANLIDLLVEVKKIAYYINEINCYPLSCDEKFVNNVDEYNFDEVLYGVRNPELPYNVKLASSYAILNVIRKKMHLKEIVFLNTNHFRIAIEFIHKQEVFDLACFLKKRNKIIADYTKKIQIIIDFESSNSTESGLINNYKDREFLSLKEFQSELQQYCNHLNILITIICNYQIQRIRYYDLPYISFKKNNHKYVCEIINSFIYSKIPLEIYHDKIKRIETIESCKKYNIYQVIADTS